MHVQATCPRTSDYFLFWHKEPGNETTSHLASFTGPAGIRHVIEVQAPQSHECIQFLYPPPPPSPAHTPTTSLQDDKGVLCYRPRPNDNGSQYFFISSSISGAVYNAMVSGTHKRREYTSVPCWLMY